MTQLLRRLLATIVLALLCTFPAVAQKEIAPTPTPASTIYMERIHAVGGTQGWARLYFFGDQYDYVLTPTRDFIELLDSSLARRFQADIRSLRLNDDNTVVLRLHATVKESSLSPKDLERYPSEPEARAGLRTVYARTVTLRRYRKTDVPLESVGFLEANNSFFIPVHGKAPQPSTQLLSAERMKGGVTLQPLTFLWFAPDEDLPPEPADVIFKGAARAASAVSPSK